ncbi:hypothetical protein [Nocardioides antri]|uniref:Uncharacterized protein n=1 Tax=Nocardioides antri TaxID=2607659 RepID=A0A5B1M3P9_9ACTN|nr:hypothetical protein [Nocardioides antri]KAA1427404.1 hypothetical protein F0U47_07975 [Nocardioides antri]
MGLFDKVRAAAEKAFADPLPPAEDARLPWDDSQPMGVLVESEWLNQATGDNQAPGHDLIDRARGIPYRFVLEVYRPGIAPYRLERRERIPAKVEGSYFGSEHRVQKGAQVPLTVTGPEPEDVAIDWEAYLALPGRMRQTKRLEIENQWDAIGARFEQTTKPATVAKIRGNSQMAVMSWAQAVRAGQLSRADFERNAEQLLRMGHLLAVDYERAVLVIEE